MKIALVFHGISHGYNEKGDITNISKDTLLLYIVKDI